MSEIMNCLIQWMPVIAAAIGALFSGIVAVYVSHRNEKKERHRRLWGEHKNALVGLERSLNGVMDEVGANGHIVGQAINAIGKIGQSTRVGLSVPQPMPFDASIFSACLRIEIVNELMSFGFKMRRLNNDTETINRAYTEMRSGLLRKDLSQEQYGQSLVEFKDDLLNLVKSYKLIDDRIFKLLARVLVSLEKDQLHDSGSFINMPIPESISVKEVDSRVMVLQQQVAEIGSQSRSEINRYFGGPSDQGV